ncbi:hypothetical protein [Blastococcus sp. VKM Ac-2987]|uniref:hypothetical protein n=1 Tax=Blastococcus sp. VKM Ac-2987 TaxID=3004141 RepID=UPI0022ABC4BD|nr:hypothetical protein [Blastococcus sp. VKM Ac-2987]MCZ2858077.1 hypothetical protein [Blastococcus sp. VKM Ac-2987]
MPLRSVEAATRDDAIAAAREQFGPHARVVGVRRVRSGGVLGFFATERYIAEVAPDQFLRPGVPSPSTGPVPAATVAAYDSPLASAAPARARSAAPARNGAAAWAAEAARSAPSGTASAQQLSVRPVTPRATHMVTRPLEDDLRLDELAGLLGDPVPASAAGPSSGSLPAAGFALSDVPSAPSTGYGRGAAATRATFPQTTREAAPAASRSQTASAPARKPATDEAPAPSPFTAALARMVSGDREVRQAVAEALEQPAGLSTAPAPATSADEPAGTPALRPTLAAAIRSADPSMRSQAVHQEETPVRDQATAPPSTATTSTTGTLPAWAEPDPVAAAPSTRQEEIAEALRAALAKGHSDEALAGILRKMLAGDPPQEAIAEPVVAPVPPEPVLVEPEVVEPEVVAPSATLPTVPEPRVAEPVTAQPVAVAVVEPLAVVEPAALEPAAFEPAASLFTTSLFTTPLSATPAAAPEPVPAPVVEAALDLAVPSSSFSLFDTPAPAAPVVDLGWDAPAVATPLWGEPATDADAPPARTDAPIRADVLLEDPAPSASADVVAPPAPVVEDWLPPVTAEAPASLPVVEDTVVVDEPAADESAATVGTPEPEEQPTATVEAAVPAVEEPDVESAVEAVAEAPSETVEVAEAAEVAPLLARTASDPAPLSMSLDATTVMPRVSLLPPLPGSRGRGLPPVPPSSSRPAVPSARPASSGAPEKTADEPAAVADTPTPAPRALATVTRLPVAPLMATDDVPELDDEDELFAASPRIEAPAQPTPTTPEEVVTRLAGLGVPQELLGEGFARRVAVDGTYAALTRVLATRLPEVPAVPGGAGEVLFLVGPGVETLRAARGLAASLRLDPDRVQWATRGDLAGLAPKGSRMTTIDAAIDRRQESATAGTVTIVAVDAPLRSDVYWMAQMLAIWSPAAVWAVVEATRKPEDLELWLDGLARVDALVVQDTDLSADPAAVLQRLAVPVALLDGVPATPHRWASLLCERLDSPQA